MKLTVAVLALAQVLAIIHAQRIRECDDCKEQLELGLVLDSSSSISRDDFAIAKKFLQEFLNKFDISFNGVRVSIITYGRTIHPEHAFYLDTYSTKEDVLNAIAQIPHEATTYTNTGEAIRFMREEQLRDDLVRPGIDKVSIVITDGNSQEWEITAAEASKARDQGITMYAIGVGNEIDHAELLRIAGDESRVDKVEGYNKLETIKEWLVKQACGQSIQPITPRSVE